MDSTTLPDYKQMTPEVRERLDRIARRPVILEGKNVFKSFPTTGGGEQTVLKDVSFQVHSREFLSIIGPSGCGKSTLIRILAGLESVSSGEILLDGKPVVEPGAERGMVFQKYTLFPWLSVCQNVMFGLESIGKDRDTAENVALQWLDIIGLGKYADYYPNQLSGGMQQRVAIARALAPQPRVLLMDEPFGALDAQTRTQMQNYLLEVWRNIDITIIFVTHDLDEAVYLSDRILALKANPGAEKPDRRTRSRPAATDRTPHAGSCGISSGRGTVPHRLPSGWRRLSASGVRSARSGPSSPVYGPCVDAEAGRASPSCHHRHHAGNPVDPDSL